MKIKNLRELIISNVVAQLFAKFFGAGLTLLTTYYTIRLGGLALYGDLTKILILVAIGFTAIDFGLNADVVRRGTTDQLLHHTLARAFSARLFLSFVAVLGLNIVIRFLPGGYSEAVKSIFWLGSLAIIFQGIYTSGNAYFQSKLSYWRSTISVIAGSLTGTFLTLYFLSTFPTLPALVVSFTVGYLVMAISTLALLPSPLLTPKLYGFQTIIPTLKSSLILGLILLASVVASKLDTILLGVFRSTAEVGEYGFAYRIFDVALVLPVFVMNSLYPLMVKNSSSRSLLNKGLLSLSALGILVGFILWFAAPLISYVKPGELGTAIASLRLLSISLPLFYVTAPLMWYLIAGKRDLLVLSVYLVAAVFNGVLNYLLIPTYGAMGSAATTGATELLIFLSLLLFSLKRV